MRFLMVITITVSMLLCIATIPLWVRSYRRTDSLMVLSRPQGSHSFISSWGRLIYGRDQRLRLSSAAARWRGSSSRGAQPPAPPSPEDFAIVGFWYGHRSSAGVWAFAVPYWFLAALLSTPTVCAVYRSMRRRHPYGHCQMCGYDLRSTRARCPECGAKPAGVAEG